MPSVTSTSPHGRAFMHGHEGNPLTCYLDVVRVPTSGRGFTMRSAAVRNELAKIGITKLVPGKIKLTAMQSDIIFDAVLRDEFEPGRRKEIANQPGATPVGRFCVGHLQSRHGRNGLAMGQTVAER